MPARLVSKTDPLIPRHTARFSGECVITMDLRGHICGQILDKGKLVFQWTATSDVLQKELILVHIDANAKRGMLASLGIGKE